MKRMLLVASVLVVFGATVLLAQAGPKREEKKETRPDTTSAPAPKKEEPAKKEEGKEQKAVKQEAPAKKQEAPKKAEESAKAPAPEQATPPPLPVESASVARAVLTGAIVDREPAAPVDTLVAPDDSLYFFTELVGMEGQTVTHRWKHGEEVMAEVPITVGAPRWRAFSKKRLIPAWAGVWTVEVVDANGSVVSRKSFVYRPN
jgi:hypothetical protein